MVMGGGLMQKRRDRDEEMERKKNLQRIKQERTRRATGKEENKLVTYQFDP